jgi:tetratricopeptide (TPR) repeat protein
MSKIGRNDPCPCGSGKKYKKCCIDKPILETVKRIPKLDYENFDYHWNSLMTFEEVKQMSTEDIIDKLIGFGIPFEKEAFLKDIEKFYSAQELSENWFSTFNVTATGRDEDFPWIASWVLWERLVPANKMSMEQMSVLIDKGYDYIREKDSRSVCDVWLDVWEAIKYRAKPKHKTLDYLDSKYSGSFFITNLVQDLEHELFKAGLKDSIYFEKCITYCKEFCSLFPKQDGTIIHNMRRTISESYLYLNKVDEAISELNSLISDYPDNPWSYIAYGDMYSFEVGIPRDTEKARGFYEKGLLVAKDDFDKQVVEERLEDLNSD